LGESPKSKKCDHVGVASNRTTGDEPHKDLGGRTNRITENLVPPRTVRQSRIFFTNLVGVVVLGLIVWSLVDGRYLPLIAACHPPQGWDHRSATSMGPPRPPFVPAERDVR